jgi:hypothetical protein
MERPRHFWSWLAGPGWNRYFNYWLLGHLAVGIAMALLVKVALSEAAKAVLLPLAGVLVGMSFAWVGNALAIAQSDEIEEMGAKNPAGYDTYVHAFQAAILVILGALVAWGLAGLGVYDEPCWWGCSDRPYFVAETLLYAIASFAVRECWGIVMGAQLMLLYQRATRHLKKPHVP